MANSQWHKFYSVKLPAPSEIVFEVLSDMPNYQRWLPKSKQFSHTTAVDPYPVQLGSRYHDGRPDERGRNWWGTVIGFQRPGSIDFRHTIRITQLRAAVDVHIHYSLEWEGGGTRVDRWLVLDVNMPIPVRPLRPVIISRFDKENVRVMTALRQYVETHLSDRAGRAGVGPQDSRTWPQGRPAPGG